MRGQQTRGQEICQLVPEQGIQGSVALQGIRRTHEQSGCNGVGMPRSLQRDRPVPAVIGFAGNALERCMRKIELNDIDKPGNIPSGA